MDRVPAFALVVRIEATMSGDGAAFSCVGKYLADEDGATTLSRLQAQVWSGATALRVAAALQEREAVHEANRRVFFMVAEAKRPRWAEVEERHDWREEAKNCGL